MFTRLSWCFFSIHISYNKYLLVHCSLFVYNFILCNKIVCVSITKQTFAERYVGKVFWTYRGWALHSKCIWKFDQRCENMIDFLVNVITGSCAYLFFLERLSLIKLMLSRYLWILWIICKHSTHVNNFYLSIIDYMLTFYPDFVGGYDCIWQS